MHRLGSDGSWSCVANSAGESQEVVVPEVPAAAMSTATVPLDGSAIAPTSAQRPSTDSYSSTIHVHSTERSAARPIYNIHTTAPSPCSPGAEEAGRPESLAREVDPGRTDGCSAGVEPTARVRDTVTDACTPEDRGVGAMTKRSGIQTEQRRRVPKKYCV